LSANRPEERKTPRVGSPVGAAPRRLGSLSSQLEDVLVGNLPARLTPATEVAGELQRLQNLSADVRRHGVEVLALVDRLHGIPTQLPFLLGEGRAGVLVGRHVAVGAKAVGQAVVLVEVDDAGVVGQVAHPSSTSGDRLDGQLGVLLGPPLLLGLDERKVPLALSQKLRRRGVVGCLHHLGDGTNLLLRVRIGAQVEEVAPFGRRDDDLVPHERLEQPVREALGRPEHRLLVDGMLAVFDALGDVHDEVTELIVLLEHPLLPLALDVVRRRRHAERVPHLAVCGIAPHGNCLVERLAFQCGAGVHAADGGADAVRREHVLHECLQLLANRDGSRARRVA